MPRRWRDGRVRASTHPTTHGNHRWPDRLACHRNLRPRPKGAWHASRRHVRRSREVLNDGRSATVGTDGRMGRNRPQGWRCSTAAETGPRQLVRGGASQKGPKCRFLEPRALTAPTFPIMLSMGVVARPQRRLVHLGEVAPGNAKTKPKGGADPDCGGAGWGSISPGRHGFEGAFAAIPLLRRARPGRNRV